MTGGSSGSKLSCIRRAISSSVVSCADGSAALARGCSAKRSASSRWAQAGSIPRRTALSSSGSISSGSHQVQLSTCSRAA